MRTKVRSIAEMTTLTVVAGCAVAAVAADTFGWIDRLSPGVISKITLIVLCTITGFLLLEMERFRALDNIDTRLSELDIGTIAKKLKSDHYAGVVQVHQRFPEDVYMRYVERAASVTILNTWIPNLEKFKESLTRAINRDARVRILLLYPNSGLAQLRDEALGKVRDPHLEQNVKQGVERCLSILRSTLEHVDNSKVARLEVKVYNSLPSISVYRADAHYLVSVFLHGQLAIDSPQFEIDGDEMVLGRKGHGGLETFWSIGKEIDVRNWERDLGNIQI